MHRFVPHSTALVALACLSSFPAFGLAAGSSKENHGGVECEYHGVSRDAGWPPKPMRTMPGDRDWGDCPPKRYQQDDCLRAGCPNRIAPWARPGITSKYSAWFVGGGAVWNRYPRLFPGSGDVARVESAQPRKANGCGEFGEGTWGLDYDGLLGRSHVWLNYLPEREACDREPMAGCRRQGGEGAYRTDGEPKMVARAKGLKEAICEKFYSIGGEE